MSFCENCNSSRASSSGRTRFPILANVLIEAKGDEVRMLATDLEVALRSRCQAAVAKGGSLTLPAKKLYEIVKALPETDVRIEEDSNGVKVAADRFDSRMQTLPREDFPTLPDVSGTARATLPRAAVKEMVAKTQFAITGEDTRYFLNGAKFVLKPQSLTLVATDGHRLALVEVQARDRCRAGRRASSSRRRRCSSSASSSPKAKATFSSRAARTTCSSRWVGAS